MHVVCIYGTANNQLTISILKIKTMPSLGPQPAYNMYIIAFKHLHFTIVGDGLMSIVACMCDVKETFMYMPVL